MKKGGSAYRRFVLLEMFVANGFINGIINGLIFYFVNKNRTSITLGFMAANLCLSLAILSLIVSALQPALLKPKIRTGKVPSAPFQRKEHWIYRLFGKNSFLDLVLSALFSTAVAMLLTLGPVYLFGLRLLSAPGAALLQAAACMLCGMLSFYFMGGSYLLDHNVCVKG